MDIVRNVRNKGYVIRSRQEEAQINITLLEYLRQDYGVNITRSVMLMELEKFDGIVVFTTNLIENYDTAFKRRIFASIEFKLPDEDARIKIWKLHMGDRLPLAVDVSVEELARQYENVSGADIKDIVY